MANGINTKGNGSDGHDTHHHHRDYRPLLPVRTTNGGAGSGGAGTGGHTWTGWPAMLFSRPACYKLLLAVVLVFLLMQFTANFMDYRHRFTISQAAGTGAGGQWSSLQSAAPQIVGHRKDPPSPSIIRGHNSRDTYVVNHSSVVVLPTNQWSLSDSPVIGGHTDNDAGNYSTHSHHPYPLPDRRPSLGVAERTVLASDSVSASRTNGETAPPVTTVDPVVSLVSNMSADGSESSLKLCPLVPPKLVGRLKVLTTSPSFDELEEEMPELESGGRYRPRECRARHRMAIIIPYRDREEHLRTFLLNIHPMLERQQLDYGIYIVEEAGNGKFNRAKLMNIGFLEAMKQYDYQCFIFHDVDLIPEDDRNLYTCPDQPRHMSVAIDKFSYRLPYKDLFGGVSALTTEQFKKINGFSNEFWGWGGEDDDMSNRVRYHGYRISRYSANIARYKMLKHKGDTPNPDRYKKLYSGKRRYKTDGINTVKYKVVDLVFKRLYTWILVDVLSP